MSSFGSSESWAESCNTKSFVLKIVLSIHTGIVLALCLFRNFERYKVKQNMNCQWGEQKLWLLAKEGAVQ